MILIHDTSFGNYTGRIKGLFYTHLRQIIDPHNKEIHTRSSSKDKIIVFGKYVCCFFGSSLEF
jgi:hypothetical protein